MLGHRGLMRARGADATAFLQGQLTNDLAGLGAQRAALAGYCSAKGRLLASFVAWRSGDDWLLACDAGVLAATLKRLSMFVLRAQCRLTDASAEHALLGLAGPSARPFVEHLAPWATEPVAGGTVVRLPDVDAVPRALLVLDAGAVRPSAPALSLDAWRLLEVRSGIATIEAATAEQFVPQMLNYELVGGVDFAKGCYPGQEVVARSQYRGTIKRRMFLFETDALAAAGQEVFHEADAAQPAGMVVNAAPRAGGTGCAALVEVKLAALEDGDRLHLGAVDGALLRRIALPYAVAAESSAAAA
ncbi:MAG TPA: folate-binding protein [Burkholderiaceae bacterium]|nr:folate-binding protein [Burkholderiaceae bacterium]